MLVSHGPDPIFISIIGDDGIGRHLRSMLQVSASPPQPLPPHPHQHPRLHAFHAKPPRSTHRPCSCLCVMLPCSSFQGYCVPLPSTARAWRRLLENPSGLKSSPPTSTPIHLHACSLLFKNRAFGWTSPASSRSPASPRQPSPLCLTGRARSPRAWLTCRLWRRTLCRSGYSCTGRTYSRRRW